MEQYYAQVEAYLCDQGNTSCIPTFKSRYEDRILQTREAIFTCLIEVVGLQEYLRAAFHHESGTWLSDTRLTQIT